MGTEEEQTRGLIDAADSLQGFAIQMDAFVADNVMPRATDLVGKFADSLSNITGVVNDLTGVPGRASGGPISAGKTYMVGEEGPELIVPSQSGTVIPNDQLVAQDTGIVQPQVDFSNIQSQVGQLNTELTAITAPDLSSVQTQVDAVKTSASEFATVNLYGLQDQVNALNAGTASLASVDIESKLATIRQGLSDVPSFVEGFKSAFLPGIGEVAEYAAGNMRTMMIKTLDGQIEEYARYNVPSSGMTVEQYQASGQTFAQGSYQIGDYQAQTGFTNMGGPRTMYDSIMADINPGADSSLQQRVPTGNESFELKEVPLNREAMALLTELKNAMTDVASNTRTGADTSKKLLRASTG